MEFNLEGIGQNPLIAAWFLIKYLGIPTLLILGFFGGRILWLNWRQGKFCSKLEYTLLAVDIPIENEQSPKAVENMFDQISGAHSTFNFTDKWWAGKCQAKFGFEIISIDGYVQFLIHTEKSFRDLVEASIYAQYPDAEITEVDDYTENSPENFPSEEYNLWGAEFIETNKDTYPIQTYPFFEHSLSQEFKDPMAALMEILASLRKGENAWLQYVVTMEGFGWVNKCKREINKVVGKDSGGNGGFLKQISKFFSDFVYGITGQISGRQETVAKQENGKNEALMLKLTPGEVESIKAIENKMGKIGFNVKMRFIYFAPKDVYTPSSSVSATVGALKQFAGPFNGFKPESKRTRTKKFLLFSEKRLASRQKKILNAYKTRSNDLGVGSGFILNSEELATVFHFPDSTAVKTSLVKKVASKKFEPPMNLPIE